MSDGAPIYFVYTTIDAEVVLRRGRRIAEYLRAACIPASHADTISNCALICFDEHALERLHRWKDNGNLVVVDVSYPSSTYQYADGLIVNSVYRKRYMLEVQKYYGPVEVIYDAWAPSDTLPSDLMLWVTPTAGVMPVLDPTPGRSNIAISIATMANVVVLTPPVPSAVELLGKDYPYYLTTMTRSGLTSKWKEIRHDHENDDAKWTRARERMDQVRAKTALDVIAPLYLEFLRKLRRASESWAAFQAWQSARNNTMVVYTAIFGGYDTLPAIPPEFKEDIVDYVCFTDTPERFSESGYQLVYLPYTWNGTVDNREPKLRYHHYLSAYTYSLYFDGGTFLIQKVSPIFEVLLRDHDIAIAKHNHHCCIYQEHLDMIGFGNIPDVERSAARMRKYREAGYPPDAGLTLNHIIVRRHTPRLQAVMEDWFAEYLHVQRDQLCLEYVLWVHGMSMNRIDWEMPNVLKDSVDYLWIHEEDRVLVQPQWFARFVKLD